MEMILDLDNVKSLFFLLEFDNFYEEIWWVTHKSIFSFYMSLFFIYFVLKAIYFLLHF